MRRELVECMTVSEGFIPADEFHMPYIPVDQLQNRIVLVDVAQKDDRGILRVLIELFHHKYQIINNVLPVLIREGIEIAHAVTVED